MNSLIQDFRYAVRMLVKKPGLVVVIVLTLALGIGANTAIFSVLDAVLIRPLAYPDPDRLVMIWQNDLTEGDGQTTVSPPNFLDWRKESESFQSMAFFLPEAFNLTGGVEPERLRGARVSADWFSVLGQSPSRGRGFHPDDDQPGTDPVVVLSHGLWDRRFGSDPGLLGQTLTLGAVPHTVVGIMPPGFAFPRKCELWVPYILSEGERNQRGDVYLQALGRLRKGVTLAVAQAEMDTIAKRLEQAYPETNTHSGVLLVRLHDQMVQRARPALVALLGAAGFVLLVACANVANLLLAHGSTRTREIAIRGALGASRNRLFSQFMIESVFLSLTGGTLGVLAALWGTEALIRLAPSGFPRLGEAHIDARVVGFAFMVSVLTGVVFGALPAFQGSRCDLHGSLKEGGLRGTGTRSTQRLRQTLVVSEVALAFVLLVGAGLMIRSLVSLQRVDPGFDPRGTLTTAIELPVSKYPEEYQQAAFFKEVVERVEALPGVRCAGSVTTLPMSGGNLVYGFTIEGRPAPRAGERPAAGLDAVTPHYLRAMRIPLLKGREFTERDDASAPKVVIINETMARTHWPGEDPIGRHLVLEGSEATREIVGVVGDVKHRGLSVDFRSEMLCPLSQVQASFGNLVIRAEGDPMALASAIRHAVWSVDPDQTLGPMRTVEQYVAASTSRPRFTMLLLGVFAVLALVLSAVGIYGVMSFSVHQRSHEIGIRMALGAKAADVAGLVLSQGIALVALGVGIGLAGAFGVTRVLRSMLFSVSPTDAPTLVGVAVLLGLIALLACYIPTRRAMKVDPMVALRYE